MSLAGTGVRHVRQPNEADSVDMFRGVYCLLHLGVAVRATTENMAGEDDDEGGTSCRAGERIAKNRKINKNGGRLSVECCSICT